MSKGFKIFGNVKVLDDEWNEVDKIKGDWQKLNDGLDKYIGCGKSKKKKR